MDISAKLVLENGTIFEGISFGYEGETIGEVCFNTGMTGYQEILTDPSYCGQIITMTYPHIGNYGINKDDVESNNIYASGFIVREGNYTPSNYRSTDSINNYLKNHNIVGIQGIDTRMLVRILRNEGSMNGIISTIDPNISSLIKKVKSSKPMMGKDLVQIVTCKQKYKWNNFNISKTKKKYKIAVIDFGIKLNILRLLSSYEFDLTVFPAQATAKEILKENPDGIFLSNGPGDPAAVTYGIKTVKALLGKKPIFGICLGHQILALALGASTFKLKFGHRGCNHPVKNLNNNKIEITSQNHGFSIDSNSIPNDVDITHTSLNDQTIEGLYSKKFSAFSVQYHPESSPGPHDSRYLFKQFIDLIIPNKINV